MELKSAFPTPERRAFPVSFVGMPTHRAFLRGVSWIDEGYLFTESLGFILKKLFKFIERPVVQFPVKLLTFPVLNPDLREVFQCEDRIIGLNNLFRDTVIGISHKPSFPSSNLTKFPLCRPGAFGLHILAKMSVFRTNTLYLPGVEKSVVRTDSNIHDPTINTKHLDFLHRLNIWMFHRSMQVKHLLFPVIGDRRRCNRPRKVLAVILGNRERRLDPSFYRCNGSKTMDQIDSDHPLVVSHCSKGLSFRHSLTFNCLQSLTRAITRTLHQRRRQIRNSLTNNPIGSLVVLNLIPHPVIESPLCGYRERRGIGSHRIEESGRAAIGHLKFERDCPNHDHILILMLEKCIGGERAIPPRPKVRGLLAHFR